ncbi:MAG: DUF7227 family protein [Planctomycetota bacterium]|jgi:hypothetical protein
MSAREFLQGYLDGARCWHTTPISKNKKTGPLAVTTSPATTCPVTCPHRGGGCYAGGADDPVKSGQGPLALHWAKVSKGERGTTFTRHLQELAKLPPSRMLRLFQAGDLPGDGVTINPLDAMALCNAAARGGRVAFGYSHYKGAANLDTLAKLNRDTGTCINSSADNAGEAVNLFNRGLPTVVSTADGPEVLSRTIAGVRFVTCPVDSGKAENCEDCGAGRPLCARKDRGFVIRFTPKGRKVALINLED